MLQKANFFGSSKFLFALRVYALKHLLYAVVYRTILGKKIMHLFKSVNVCGVGDL